MNELVPDKARIDRAGLERIIRRAAELQAQERDIGEGLTEPELMHLGYDVGIPAAYLQRALLEERTRAIQLDDSKLAGWLTGPRQIAVQRSVPENAEGIEAALGRWMIDGELLSVKRRYPDRTSWEARQDMFSSIKREFKVGGRPYRLARAKEIVGTVTDLEPGRSHVQLSADLSNTRRSHLTGAATVTGIGGLATAIGVTLGVALPVALLPIGLGLLAGLAIARHRRSRVEETQVALEQVLDRLEHGEIPRSGKPALGGVGTIKRIADEIKRSLGP
ncbi:MAG: hypothetical protein OER90_00445 [Gemmatimonadota bacterium]|nr:hypothetical protein [Gemmatimonadota bacterium]